MKTILRNTDWIVGKWKIYEQPFEFFPFEYDDRICQLNKVAIIELKNNHQFLGKTNFQLPSSIKKFRIFAKWN